MIAVAIDEDVEAVRAGCEGIMYPVLIDAERCIGCKYCLVVCPFGIIELSRDGKAMVTFWAA